MAYLIRQTARNIILKYPSNPFKKQRTFPFPFLLFHSIYDLNHGFVKMTWVE